MVTKIRAATDKVWPEVSRALQLTTLRIAEIAEIADLAVTEVEAYVSGHEQGRWKRRQLCTETVWALARLGHLRTGEEHEIVHAAQALREALRSVPDEDLEEEDIRLIKAVDALPSWE
jgi:hypothetical protein